MAQYYVNRRAPDGTPEPVDMRLGFIDHFLKAAFDPTNLPYSLGYDHGPRHPETIHAPDAKAARDILAHPEIQSPDAPLKNPAELFHSLAVGSVMVTLLLGLPACAAALQLPFATLIACLIAPGLIVLSAHSTTRFGAYIIKHMSEALTMCYPHLVRKPLRAIESGVSEDQLKQNTNQARLETHSSVLSKHESQLKLMSDRFNAISAVYRRADDNARTVFAYSFLVFFPFLASLPFSNRMVISAYMLFFIALGLVGFAFLYPSRDEARERFQLLERFLRSFFRDDTEIHDDETPPHACLTLRNEQRNQKATITVTLAAAALVLPMAALIGRSLFTGQLHPDGLIIAFAYLPLGAAMFIATLMFQLAPLERLEALIPRRPRLTDRKSQELGYSADFLRVTRRFNTAPDSRGVHRGLLYVGDLDSDPTPTGISRAPLGLSPRITRGGHSMIFGASGYGKTNAAMREIEQDIDTLRRGDDRFSIVIVANQYDRAQFQTAAIAARLGEVPLPFRFLTLDVNQPCHGFNPFEQEVIKHLTDVQLSDHLLYSLGMLYGSVGDYGKSFFTGANAIVFRRLIQVYKPKSFADLLAPLAMPQQKLANALGLSVDIIRKADELHPVIDQLSHVPALNLRQDDERLPIGVRQHAIDWTPVLTEPHVILISCDADHEPRAYQYASNCLTSSLLGTAGHIPMKDRIDVKLYIDEAQRAVKSNLLEFLEQARKKKIWVTLANQSPSQFDPKDFSTMHECVQRVQAFSAKSDDLQGFLLSLSDLGWEVDYPSPEERKLYPNLNAPYIPQANLAPGLLTGELLDINADPGERSVLLFYGDNDDQVFGFRGRPRIISNRHHIAKEEHERRSKLEISDLPESQLEGTFRPRDYDHLIDPAKRSWTKPPGERPVLDIPQNEPSPAPNTTNGRKKKNKRKRRRGRGDSGQNKGQGPRITPPTDDAPWLFPDAKHKGNGGSSDTDQS